uniref:Uncharacterized protein n=1 Tax=Kalanchoe fedtschenkoi TaxID=63787 RepID=A0A7N0U7Y3_KALFE
MKVMKQINCTYYPAIMLVLARTALHGALHLPVGDNYACNHTWKGALKDLVALKSYTRELSFCS